MADGSRRVAQAVKYGYLHIRNRKSVRPCKRNFIRVAYYNLIAEFRNQIKNSALLQKLLVQHSIIGYTYSRSLHEDTFSARKRICSTLHVLTAVQEKQ